MKTPDEIKIGMKCCEKYMNGAPEEECCHVCNYAYNCAELKIDSFAYIQQLEAERDAAVADLKRVEACKTCKHFRRSILTEPCLHCVKQGLLDAKNNYVWRGVQTAEKRHAQVGDYVKIVKITSPVKRFRVGGVYKVVQLETEWNIPGAVILDCGGYYASSQEYEVLEGYKPDTKEE